MTDRKALRVVFAGTPEFAAVALQALLDSDHQVVGVLTQPDRPAGRGRKLTPSPVKLLAVSHDIPVQQPVSLRNAEAYDALASLQADVMVVAAYGLILPANVLALPQYGCLNIHASLLPRWRGAAPIHRALLAGDAQSGVCIMQMDEGLDTGDVLHRLEIVLNDSMNAEQLHDALAELGAQALMQVMAQLSAGDELIAQPQPQEGITYAEKLSKSEALLDFSDGALALHRKIQAFNPWPVAETQLDGERLRIWGSRLVDHTASQNTPKGQSGEVVQLLPDAVRVATSDGFLDLTKIQRSGKKPVDAADFSRGLALLNKVLG